MPKKSEKLLKNAMALYNDHQLLPAKNIFLQILAEDSRNQIALYYLAAVLNDMGEHVEAIETIKRLKDHNYFSLHLLGMCYYGSGQPDLAIHFLKRALSLDNRRGTGHFNLAKVLISTGQLEETKKHLSTAIALDSSIAEKAKPALASLYEKEGKSEEAFSLALDLLRGGDTSNFVFSTLSKICISHPVESSLIHEVAETMEKNLTEIERKEGSFSIKDMDALFALANLYEKERSFSKAFHYYKHANNLIKTAFDYDHFAKAVDSIIHENYEMTTSSQKDDPIFVVGLPRSGSSLVDRILSMSSRIYSVEENNLLETLIRNHGKNDALFSSFRDKPTTKKIISREYKKTLGKESTIILNKYLDNIYHVGQIFELFENPKVIIIQKNPLDNCFSIYKSMFFIKNKLPTKIENFAEFHNKYHELVLHWLSRYGDKILNIYYEDLVANPEEISQRLYRYCGLDWDKSCLDFYKKNVFYNTASYSQVKQPIYRSAVDRWRNYEPHLSPLINDLILPEFYRKRT